MNLRKISFFIPVVILSFYSSLFSSSQETSGPIAHHTVWKSDTVKVTADIIVFNGTTLTIKPGTCVEFQGAYRINVNGTLIAKGSESDSVIFTAVDSIRWLGIVFNTTAPDNDSSIISFCRLEYCSVDTLYEGGAIHIKNYSKLRIDNCLIQNNIGRGGGIRCDNASPLITNNNITNNIGIFEGGGIFCVNKSMPLIVNNIIQYNCSNGGCTVGRGGGIFCENASPFIINNLIVNNRASGRASYGGGILCDGHSNPAITNNTIANNYAKYGGGIHCWNYTSQPVITSTILWGNSHGQIEGNLHQKKVRYSTIQEGFPGTENSDYYPQFKDTMNGDWSLDNASYCINTGLFDTTGLLLPPKDIAGNTRIYEGHIIDRGAYEFQGTPPYAQIYIFEKNLHSISHQNRKDTLKCIMTNVGSLPLHIDSITIAYGTQFTIVQSIPNNTSLSYFEKDTVIIKVQPFALGEYADTLSVYHGDTVSTIALHAVIIEDYATIINTDSVCGRWGKEYSPYCVFRSITIPRDSLLLIEPGTTVRFYGYYNVNIRGSIRAIGNGNDTILFTIHDTTGFNDFKTTRGSWHGICFVKPSPEIDSSIFEYTQIEYAKAIGYIGNERNGGALYVEGFQKVRISHCLLKNNYAEDNGAGIYCGSAPILIENTSISNNYGSGIYFHRADGIIKNCIVSQNSNVGIYCYSATPSIIGCTIHANINQGILCRYSNAHIAQCSINKNTASGIFCATSNPLIVNTRIENNGTKGAGGGILFYYSSGKIVNCLITNNRAGSGGGILSYNSRDLIKIVNTTLCNNSAKKGGGIYLERSVASVKNTVVFGNKSDSAGAQVFLMDTGSITFFTYCDIQGGSAEFAGEGTPALYEHNSNKFPEFQDSANGDWSLKNTSPCINKGTPDTSGLSIPLTDIAGNPRYVHGRIDIGAYEYQGLVSITTTDASIHVDKISFSAFPNPVSPDDAAIKFFFNSGNTINAELTIFDALGNKVFSYNHPVPAPANSINRNSFAEWNIKNEKGRPVSAGSYLAILKTEERYGKINVYRVVLGIESGGTH